jgi:hypothetical protein
MAIIGLASNIISFIEFGLKIAAGARYARDSPHGTTEEVCELDLIVSDIRESNEAVVHWANAPSSQRLSAHEKRILAMAHECENVAKELKETIRSLQMREGRPRALEGGRVAFLGLWKQRDIESMRRRLEALDARIRVHIANALQR